MSLRVLPIRQWLRDGHRCWWIQGADCRVFLVPRPNHCDRGRFLAQLDLDPRREPEALHVDSADLWPRYYFDFERAKAEVEAWLIARKQVQE